MYTKTYKTDTDNPLIRFEEEEIISAREYRKLMKSRRVDIPPLRKQRVCFVWEEQYFELDVFKDMDLMLLEIELTEEHSIVSLPPWLPIIREVTSEINFRNVEIAKTISHS
jgi:CYTH domain-containing protein